MAKLVGPRRTARTNRRIASVRLANPKALPNIQADGSYTPREARRVRKVAKRTYHATKDAAAKKQAAAKAKDKRYDPLAPLTGSRLNKELDAAVHLKYGDAEGALAQSKANQAQTTANTGTYYDDYRNALAEATARIKANSDASVQAQQQRVDQSSADMTQHAQEQDAQASQQAALLGRGPVQTQAAYQSADAAKSQGNLSAGHLREQANSQNTLMEMRGATAVQAKAEALGRAAAKSRQLDDQGVALKKEEGDYRVDQRRQSREDERSYAAIKQEFGLKTKEFDHQKKVDRATVLAKNQASNAQKVVARIYGSANKAQARAQVRVAELQLKKGKISKHQFTTIKNIYDGLPTHKSVDITYHGNGAGAKGKAKGTGPGSGAGGSFAPWEKDKISNAVNKLTTNSAKVDDRDVWIQRMVSAGVPKRLARTAWNKYVRQHNKANTPHPGGNQPGANGQKRPT